MRNLIFAENSASGASSTSSSSSSSFHSSITNTQFPSNNSISSSSGSSDFPSCSNRCRGLDLLVKAIQQVSSGSVVGIPYAQRRVLIRRRRRKGFLNFNIFTMAQLLCNDVKKERVEDGHDESNSTPMRKKRSVALPSKYSDSILQTWKPRSVGGWIDNLEYR